MHKPAPLPMAKLELFLLLIVAGGLLLRYLASFWSYSEDVAHHYALIAYLAENWSLPPEKIPYLGEMNFYPRLSHGIAAAFAYIFHSPLLGMQFVALSSLLLCWIALLSMVRSLPGKSSYWGAGLLLLLLLCNEKWHLLNLHGGELYEGFFFAQLVAQSLSLLTLFLCMRAEQNQIPDWLRTLFLMLMVYLLTGMHLLPALQLLGVMAGLLALDLWEKRHLPRPQTALYAVRALAFLALSLYLVLKHPGYAAMREVSTNNGYLHMRGFSSMGTYYLFISLISLFSIWMLYKWYRLRDATKHVLACKYLALASLVTCTLCLLQVVMLAKGAGSEYAVKKYVFSINSLFVLQLACLPALLKPAARLQQEAAQAASVYRFLFLPLLLLLSVSIQMPAPSTRLPELLKIEQQLQAQLPSLRSLAKDKQIHILPGPGIEPGLAYMFSVGQIGNPRDSNNTDIRQGKLPQHLARVSQILVNPGPFAELHADCRIPFPALKMVVLESGCVARKMGLDLHDIDFGGMGNPPECKLEGFSKLEYDGRWSEARQAQLRCQILYRDNKRPSTLMVNVSGFVHQNLRQRVKFKLKGQPGQELELSPEKFRTTLQLPLPNDSSQDFVLQFELPDAVAPRQLGLGEDSRLLGIMLHSIKFK